MVRRGAHSRYGDARMTCKQGVSRALGDVNLAKHSQTVSSAVLYGDTNCHFG